MSQTSATATTSAGFPWEQVIPLVPDLLWLVAIIIFLSMIGITRIKTALSRATKVGIAGLEIELKAEVEAAAAARSVQVGSPEAGRAARRLAAAADLLAGARLLWVDDEPSNNVDEIKILRSMNVSIDLATSTTEAKGKLDAGAYEVVLSDMSRDGNAEAGKQLVSLVANAVPAPSLIYYVGKPHDVPAGAFGLTTRPDELFHLIADALSRMRG